jgi:hypothetical protein
MKFQTYEITKHNPFQKYPHEKYIVAEADSEGFYALHIRFENGLGLTSIDKMTLYEAVSCAFKYQEELGLPRSALWIDVPAHVLDKPDILSKKLKNKLQRSGLYWAVKNGRFESDGNS